MVTAMCVVDFIFTGDLILDEPNPDHWLSGIAPATSTADVTIGHLEVPHTNRSSQPSTDVPAPGAAPAYLAALVRAGFDVVTLAGNHIADCGPDGIADTRTELARLGIACCGADLDLDHARRPAVQHRDGRDIAVLSYNCVGPEASWASPSRAGCAYVRVARADGTPISPAAVDGIADPESVRAMQADIAAAAAMHDLVIVSLHKGIVHTPVRLANYERPVAHAAIDAGADVVVGHHAHIVRGIEFYRDKPIYHGLGNGCVVTRALSGVQSDARRADWARERKLRFGFEPDPAYTLAPFHPEAVNSMLGRVRWFDDGRLEAGFVPVRVCAPGRPQIAAGDSISAISAYIAQITVAAGLPALAFAPQADMVRIVS